MSTRGRKPKPTALKLLTGNPGKRPLPENEPKPPPVAPRCPHWLHKEAKKEWKRIAPILEQLGLLTQADMAALAGYCQSWAQFREATEFIHKNGHAYPIWERSEDGSVKRDEAGKPILRYMQQWPQVSIANQALKQIRSFCSEFGLTPSARGRISIPTQETADEYKEFRRGKSGY